MITQKLQLSQRIRGEAETDSRWNGQIMWLHASKSGHTSKLGVHAVLWRLCFWCPIRTIGEQAPQLYYLKYKGSGIQLHTTLSTFCFHFIYMSTKRSRNAQLPTYDNDSNSLLPLFDNVHTPTIQVEHNPPQEI
jgi:hypothetical protein